jgi:uncharacterized membrane protein YGL010W
MRVGRCSSSEGARALSRLNRDAGATVDAGDPLLMWSAAAMLFLVGWSFQFLGHAVFERRRPAFVDDLSQTLIGPMFVVAKMLVRFGMRRDLATFLAEERGPVKSLSVSERRHSRRSQGDDRGQ